MFISQILNFLLNILIIVGVLSVLVFIHELGHFLVAKLFKMYVIEFAIGMGPLIYTKKIGETYYSVRLLPLGGFVRILGESYDDSLETAMRASDVDFVDNGKSGEKGKHVIIEPKLDPENDKRSFVNKASWKRFLLMVAGVSMNMILAASIFHIILARNDYSWTLVGDVDRPLPFGEISKVKESELVYSLPEDENFSSGARDADWPEIGVIMSVEGESVYFTSEFREHLKSYAGKSATFSVCDYNIESSIVGECNEYETYVNDDSHVGIFLYPNYFYNVSYNGAEKVFAGWVHIVNQLDFTFQSLPKYVSQLWDNGEYKSVMAGTVSSPVGMYFLIDGLKEFGFSPIFELVAQMSMFLAIINILPIPALDGGRIILLIPEMIFKKRLDPHIENLLIQYSFYFLLLLMILVVLKDIVLIDVLKGMFF